MRPCAAYGRFRRGSRAAAAEVSRKSFSGRGMPRIHVTSAGLTRLTVAAATDPLWEALLSGFRQHEANPPLTFRPGSRRCRRLAGLTTIRRLLLAFATSMRRLERRDNGCGDTATVRHPVTILPGPVPEWRSFAHGWPATPQTAFGCSAPLDPATGPTRIVPEITELVTQLGCVVESQIDLMVHPHRVRR